MKRDTYSQITLIHGYMPFGLFCLGLTNQKQTEPTIKTSQAIQQPIRTKPNRPKLKRPDAKPPKQTH